MLKYVHGSTMIIVTTTAISPCMIEAQMNLEAHLLCADCKSFGCGCGRERYLSMEPNSLGRVLMKEMNTEPNW